MTDIWGVEGNHREGWGELAALLLANPLEPLDCLEGIFSNLPGNGSWSSPAVAGPPPE